MASSDSELDDLCLLYVARRRKTRPSRRFWVRPILTRRREQGEFHQLLQEMRLSDAESHFRYVRMSKERFDALLSKVGPLLTRRHYSSAVRPSITPAERLAVTLRFLATGNSQVSLSFNFRMGRSTVSGIVRETCDAIWTVLQPEYVKTPSTPSDWLKISKGFLDVWNFPNCIGAIDGKHIQVQAPANSGSQFFNYKGTHSIVLLAVCDAYYRFVLVDVGDSGKQSDGGVLGHSVFGRALERSELAIPPKQPLPGTSTPHMPFVIVGDEAFPLKEYMMRPFPGRYLPEDQAVYNYRLSRARMVIENAFGIMAARWQLFRRPINASPDNVVAYSKACIALHNYLRTEESHAYCPSGFGDSQDADGNLSEGAWRQNQSAAGLLPVGSVGGNRYASTAADIRVSFKEYFSSTEGEVPWQLRMVRRTS